MLLEISRSSPSRGGPMNLKTGGPFELKIQPSGGPFLVETGTAALPRPLPLAGGGTCSGGFARWIVRATRWVSRWTVRAWPGGARVGLFARDLLGLV
jgi:hypothetical protein